jgi:hypothetical protein
VGNTAPIPVGGQNLVPFPATELFVPQKSDRSSNNVLFLKFNGTAVVVVRCSVRAN